MPVVDGPHGFGDCHQTAVDRNNYCLPIPWLRHTPLASNQIWLIDDWIGFRWLRSGDRHKKECTKSILGVCRCCRLAQFFAVDTALNQILDNKRIFHVCSAAPMGARHFETVPKNLHCARHRRHASISHRAIVDGRKKSVRSGPVCAFFFRVGRHPSGCRLRHHSSALHRGWTRINIYLARILHHQIFKWINCKRWWFATDTIRCTRTQYQRKRGRGRAI